MTEYQITKVTANRETDVLSVEGYALDNVTIPLTAQGWVSAMTNHFDPDSYDQDGNRVEGAEPRAMTNAEKKAYILDLVKAADVRPMTDSTPAPAEEDLTDLFG